MVEEEQKEEKKEEKEEKKPKERWGLGEVAKTTDVVIVDNKTGEGYDLKAAISKVLNNQEKLMKLLD